MKVRTVTQNDYENIVKLENEIWGNEAASYDVIKSRHDVFPEGSLVVVDDDKIVGYAAVQKVTRACGDSWFKQTDDGYIKSTHDEIGHILYGIGMSGNKFGVSELIIDYAHKAFISSGICYMLVLGSRLPGFRAWTNRTGNGITEYIKARRPDGLSVDPELRLYQKHGFEVLFEIESYFPCKDSLDYGALIVKR